MKRARTQLDCGRIFHKPEAGDPSAGPAHAETDRTRFSEVVVMIHES
jgi:hypothetical protein